MRCFYPPRGVGIELCQSSNKECKDGKTYNGCSIRHISLLMGFTFVGNIVHPKLGVGRIELE